MDNFILEARPKIIFGKGQINSLKEIIPKYNNILFVYGEGSIKSNGIYDEICKMLKDKKVYELSGITPNPKLSDIKKGIKICKNNNIDFIIAVGGGSVIDASKAISIGAKNKEDIWDIIVNKKKIHNKIDLGTITTMIATGSETNDIFVVYNDDINLKRSLKTKYAYPTFAIMDPMYTLTISKRHTTNGIVDTMSHILEQYINNKNNPIIDQHLLLLFKNMKEVGEKLINNLESYELRARHMYIAMIAYNGDYRTIVNGDWACHGMDYGLASVYNNFHGEGLSIITPNWLEYVYYNKEKNKKIEQILNNTFDGKSIKENISLLRNYFKKIGAPVKYSEIEEMKIILNDEILKIMVEKSQFIKPLGGTINLNEDDIKEIYKMGV